MVDLTPSLTLVRAELRGAARRPRWYLARAAVGGLLVLTLVGMYRRTFEAGWIGDSAALSQLAATYFSFFAAAQLAAVALLLPGLVASSVPVERDRRTIDDLLVSPLSNAGIVLGKALTRLLLIIMLSAAGLGVLAIASLLGGSDLREFTRLAVITASTAWAITGLSMALSVRAPRTRVALSRVYQWLVTLWLAPPLVYYVFFWVLPTASLPFWTYDVVRYVVGACLILNPFLIYFRAGSGLGLLSPQIALGAMTLLHAAIGVAGLAWAVARVRVPLATASSFSLRNWWSRPLERRACRGRWPMIWKDCSPGTRGSQLVSIALAACVLCFVGWYWWYSHWVSSSWREDFLSVLQVTQTALSSLVLLLVACRASSAVTGERERDTWVSLLGTPLSGTEIMAGKLVGAIHSVRWMLGLLGVLGVVAVLVDVRTLPAVLGTAIVMGVLLVAAASLGLTVSRHVRTTTRALAMTLVIGLTAGGGYLFLCVPLMLAGGGGGDELILAGVLPFLIAFPGICFAEDPPGSIIGAFSWGMICYTLATVTLLATHQREIDRISEPM